MSEALKEELTDEAGEFLVTDDRMAEWCLRKIREAQEDVRRWQRHYEAQLRKAQAEADQTVAFMTAKLEQYFDSVPHRTAKTQESYWLPSAKLVRKRQQPLYTTDDAVLVPWLEENYLDKLVKTKKTADWAGLKKFVTLTPDGTKVMTDDGEIVPGVDVTQRPDVFRVEMEEEEHV